MILECEVELLLNVDVLIACPESLQLLVIGQELATTKLNLNLFGEHGEHPDTALVILGKHSKLTINGGFEWVILP